MFSKLFKSMIPFTFVGCASVHTEVTIKAKPEIVWNILNDTKRYPEWNPTMVKAEGRFQEGEKIDYRFRETSEKEYDIQSTVKRVVPIDMINQRGGVWGVITFDHVYKLEPIPEGTRVTQHEEYRGIYVPFWNTTNVKAAYERLNAALKKRAEELQQ